MGIIDDRFTGLRGIAALNVLLAHYTNIGLIHSPLLRFSGQFGVFIFFFLSAFLLAFRMNTDLKKLTLTQSLILYAINRAFRIVPLVLIVSIACYFFGIYCYTGNEGVLTPFYMPFYLDKAPGVFWTIPVEMVFYVYLPVLFGVFFFFRQYITIIFFMYCIWCILIALTPIASQKTWVTLGIHHYANCFVGGLVFFFITKQSQLNYSGSNFAAWFPMLAIFLLFPYPLSFIIGDRQMNSIVLGEYHDRVFPLIPLILGGLFLYALQENSFSHFLRFRGFVWFGQVSFPVYLIHMPLATVIKVYLPANSSLALFLSITVVLFIAFTLHKGIEIPLIAFGKRVGAIFLTAKTPSS